jgi:hypothetical protein
MVGGPIPNSRTSLLSSVMEARATCGALCLTGNQQRSSCDRIVGDFRAVSQLKQQPIRVSCSEQACRSPAVLSCIMQMLASHTLAARRISLGSSCNLSLVVNSASLTTHGVRFRGIVNLCMCIADCRKVPNPSSATQRVPSTVALQTESLIVAFCSAQNTGQML